MACNNARDQKHDGAGAKMGLLSHPPPPHHAPPLPELRAECESKREVSETGEEVEEGAVGRDASAARLQRHPPSSLLPPSSQLNAARLASAVASHVDAARSGAALLTCTTVSGASSSASLAASSGAWTASRARA